MNCKKIILYQDKKLITEIGSLIHSFNQSLQQYLPALHKEVNQLIDAKTVDARIIEHHLDTLLSLTMHGIADNLFIQLLEYYKTITEGALFYWNAYDNEEE